MLKTRRRTSEEELFSSVFRDKKGFSAAQLSRVAHLKGKGKNFPEIRFGVWLEKKRKRL